MANAATRNDRVASGGSRLCLRQVPCSATLSSTSKLANPGCSGSAALGGSRLISSQRSFRAATRARRASVGLPCKLFVICDRYCSAAAGVALSTLSMRFHLGRGRQQLGAFFFRPSNDGQSFVGSRIGLPAFSEASDAAVVLVTRQHLGNHFLHHCGRHKLVKHRSQDQLLYHAATDADGVFACSPR